MGYGRLPLSLNVLSFRRIGQSLAVVFCNSGEDHAHAAN